MRRFFRVALLLALAGIAGAQRSAPGVPDIPAMQRLWSVMKNQLSGPNGQAYFENNLKGSELPFLYGTVLSALPKDKPLLVILAMSGKSEPEVNLRMAAALTDELPAGTEVLFRGEAREFSSDPFRLTISPDAIRVHTARPK